MAEEPTTVHEDALAAEAAEPIGDPADESTTARRVPVSESIRYRRRAQVAERKLRELEARHEQAEQALNEAQQQITDAERRQRIDQLLSESDTVDLEAARLLTEIAVQQMAEPDVAAAVDELRRSKPYLFRRCGGAQGGGAMAPRCRDNGAVLADVAEHAATTGNRRDLLRYLRMRRNQ